MQIDLIQDVSSCDTIASDDGVHMIYQAGPKRRSILLAVDDEGAERVHALVREINAVTTEEPGQ